MDLTTPQSYQYNFSKKRLNPNRISLPKDPISDLFFSNSIISSAPTRSTTTSSTTTTKHYTKQSTSPKLGMHGYYSL
jgi:hypothetical protein